MKQSGDLASIGGDGAGGDGIDGPATAFDHETMAAQTNRDFEGDEEPQQFRELVGAGSTGSIDSRDGNNHLVPARLSRDVGGETAGPIAAGSSLSSSGLLLAFAVLGQQPASFVDRRGGPIAHRSPPAMAGTASGGIDAAAVLGNKLRPASFEAVL